jgi:hypothetical protein
MHEIEIERYTPGCREEWDSFVRQSRNGTFLFCRDYMDYHSDRFCDHSLMARHKGRLYAVLPANQEGSTLHSHQGLTYGGWVVGDRVGVEGMGTLFRLMTTYAHGQGLSAMTYKAIPWIYHTYPTEEDLYALHHACGAQLESRHVSSAIHLQHPIPFIESRKSGLRKAVARELIVNEVGQERLGDFWAVLEANLSLRHQVAPVHRLEEMRLLMGRFPHNIRLFVVTGGDCVLGGTLLYVTPRVIHTQYISASEEGKSCGALDLLFHHLLSLDWGDAEYLDFGRSSMGNGSELNSRLLFQKEGFGGRAVCYDTYAVTF